MLPPSPCMTSLEVSRCAWSLWCAGQVFRGDQQGSHKQHVLTSPAQCESIQAEKKRAGGARGHRETEKRDVIPGMPLILLSWWHCSHFVFLLFFFWCYGATALYRVSLPSQAHLCVLLPHYCPMGCLVDWILAGRAQERDKEVFTVLGTKQMRSPWQWKRAVSSCLQVAGILAAVHKHSVYHHQISCSVWQRKIKPG